MIEEQDFRLIVSAALRNLLNQVDGIDSDDLDNRLSEGVLQTDFEGGGVFVLSQQVPTRELWLSAFSRAWHFRLQPAGGGARWMERDTSEPMEEVLSAIYTKRLGKPVRIVAP